MIDYDLTRFMQSGLIKSNARLLALFSLWVSFNRLFKIKKVCRMTHFFEEIISLNL